MRQEYIFQELNSLVEHVSSSLHAERCSFFLLNHTEEKIYSIVAEGLKDFVIELEIDQGLVGHVIRSEKPMIDNNVENNLLFDQSFDQITSFRTKQILCVPIFDKRNKVIGAIQVLNKLKGKFERKDQQYLESIALTSSLLIKNSALFLSTNKIKNTISNLLKISSSISSELELDNLLSLIIDKTAEITQSERSTFFVMDEKSNELWSKIGKGLDQFEIRTQKGIVWKVSQSKKPQIENNPYSSQYFNSEIDKQTGYRTRNIVSVPVLNAENKVLGVIQAINKQDGVFGKSDVYVLQSFASQISIALQNSKHFSQIKEMKNYLDLLFENLDNGIITLDEVGQIKTVNKKFCEILGQPKSVFVNKHYKQLNDSLQPTLKYNELLFRSGKKFNEYGLETTKDNDKKLVINLSSLPMQNEKGENIGAINVISDVTKESRIKENLSRYLPRHVINEIMSKDDLSLLNGKYRRASILFCDLRNFTGLTEKFGAIQIVKFLNDFFNSLVDSIFKFNGILDKLIGDAMMAVFGIPYSGTNDPLNAVKAGLNMLERLEEINIGRSEEEKLKVGIGIATGNVVSGNIGSEKRFEYTVIGDKVNLASRLEAATKVYNTDLLICENTFDKVKSEYYCREVDRIQLKGKKQFSSMYTVEYHLDQEISKEKASFLSQFKRGFDFYLQKKYHKAIACFIKARGINDQDKPLEILISKCNEKLVS